MKFVSIVGARPQFVKAAALSRELRKTHKEILIHTGQHYDHNMSDIFFSELQIPKPDYNLNIGSGSHGAQTGIMLKDIEEVIINEKPDGVIVYGDTNSTLAGALAASKLLIPVFHVEAGLRSYNKEMPEEQNRILTDHISKLLLCPTDTAVINLEKEGIREGVKNVGDIMMDTVLYYKVLAKETTSLNDIIDKYNIGTDEFYLSTLHRAENTQVSEKIETILNAFETLNKKVVLPLHPRTKKIVDKLQLNLKNVVVIDPVSYFEMLILLENCIKVITDSGGLQKEAFFMEKQCITLREQTEWVETLNGNWNRLCSIDEKEIIDSINSTVLEDAQKDYFGSGNTASEIVKQLENYYI